MAILITIPAAVNYRGVRSGANLSSLMTLAKLLSLALLIVFGVALFAQLCCERAETTVHRPILERVPCALLRNI
jgi:hypothetical protein